MSVHDSGRTLVKGSMEEIKIQFLADRPEAIPIIAQWYLEEWGHKEPENSVRRTCL